jgi:hypothetical protein
MRGRSLLRGSPDESTSAELLNGLFVLIVASLLSAAVAVFQVSFNLQLWVSILVGMAIAVAGYVVFEFVLSAEQRETEWLKRIGTPARFEAGPERGGQGGLAFLDAIREDDAPH